MSSKHRLDPTTKADGQQFMVYRVLGGPDRVSKYGTSFVTGASTFRSIQFKATGEDAQYSVPQYTQTDHHGWSNLRSGTSPYVQFGAPMNHNGGASQKGVLKDATQISTGVYCVAADKSGDHQVTQAYYLNDIPTYASATGHYQPVTTVHYQPVTSAGQAPQSGDEQILYGYCFDVQHPPAMLMGAWDLRESHSDQNALQSLGKVLNGATTPGNQQVYLSVNAWPTYIPDREEPGGGWISGSFTEEYALEGHYYWAGTGSPPLRLDWGATFSWQVQNNGSPASRTCGLGVWLGGPSGHDDSSSRWGYQNVGFDAGSQLTGWCQTSMAPSQQFYISFGPHMQADWGGHGEMGYDDWHHWQAAYAASGIGLTLTLPQ